MLQETGLPQSVPWAAKTLYPSMSVINVLYTRAVSSTVQPSGGGEEKMKPGRDGTTTWKETGLPVDVFAFCVRYLMIGANARKEPGQPWLMMSGMASGSDDLSWMKWIVRPSMSAV